MFAALLDTCVLWPSLQRDFLLSLAVEGMYRPLWSAAIIEELAEHETRKLVRRGEEPAKAVTRTLHLLEQMSCRFDDAEVQGWEGLEGAYGTALKMWVIRSGVGRYGLVW
jgi:hypothetical protein